MTSPELFRDISGTKTAAAIAASAASLSQQGATTAGELATKNFERHLKLQQKVADIALERLAAENAADRRAAGPVDPTMTGAAVNAAADRGDKAAAAGGEGGSAGTGSGTGTGTGEKGLPDVAFLDEKADPVSLDRTGGKPAAGAQPAGGTVPAGGAQPAGGKTPIVATPAGEETP